MKSWNELKWWESRECANLHEQLRWSDRAGWPWYPAQRDVYRALHETPFASVKCVIVGQDPYHTRGLATGLAFSVPPSLPRENYPPSLFNIFKELCNDLHCPYPKSGDLTAWAKRGVLLWNTALTVAPGKAGSHRGWWDTLTREVLDAVSTRHERVVFVFWGGAAQKYLPTVMPSVEARRNAVCVSPHPSPLSASRGFFGSRPFSSVNTFLKSDAIDWRLP